MYVEAWPSQPLSDKKRSTCGADAHIERCMLVVRPEPSPVKVASNAEPGAARPPMRLKSSCNSSEVRYPISPSSSHAEALSLEKPASANLAAQSSTAKFARTACRVAIGSQPSNSMPLASRTSGKSTSKTATPRNASSRQGLASSPAPSTTTWLNTAPVVPKTSTSASSSQRVRRAIMSTQKACGCGELSIQPKSGSSPHSLCAKGSLMSWSSGGFEDCCALSQHVAMLVTGTAARAASWCSASVAGAAAAAIACHVARPEGRGNERRSRLGGN
mmetsp:Transcript_148613/g.477135  ORF Transcript_148613/g.477135 Transcript_148613/m.477135 type:complete len:274 (-) Transcript_148613:8-829(-)